MKSLIVLAMTLAMMASNSNVADLRVSKPVSDGNSVAVRSVQEDNSSSQGITTDEEDEGEASDYSESFFEEPKESEDEIEDQTDYSDVDNSDDEEYVEPTLEEKYEANMNFDETNEWWDVPSCDDGSHVWSVESNDDGTTVHICKRCGQAYTE